MGNAKTAKSAAGKKWPKIVFFRLLTNIPTRNILFVYMWKIETTSGWKNSTLDFSAQRPNELAALLRNLSHYFALLRFARNHKTIEASYLEFLESGIVSINQNGIESGLADCRLYVFPDETSRTLYLLCVGNETDKNSDLEYFKQFLFYLVNART
jgi:hypothetical protein